MPTRTRRAPSSSARSAPRRPARPRGLTYAASGVNLEEKDAFTESLETVLRRTHGPRVIPNPGGFAGLFRLDRDRAFKRNYKAPVLVACTDGCGTKVKLATQLRTFDTIGIDLVAMSVNDMIVQRAEPLFFLDYIAVSKVDSRMLGDVVRGVAEGCRQSGCALIGGETAEMPDVYPPGEFDLAGFAVGVVELAQTTRAPRPQKGDLVLGLASSGVHSNGYSLVRKIVDAAALSLNRTYAELAPSAPASARVRRATPTDARTLGQVLLTPTRIYVRPIVDLMSDPRLSKAVSGMANITGSGMAGNLCRALHPAVDAIIDRSSWLTPPLFRFLQERGGVSTEEMHRVFNMGIGYTLIVRPAHADAVKRRLEKLGETVYTIGEIARGTGRVQER